MLRKTSVQVEAELLSFLVLRWPLAGEEGDRFQTRGRAEERAGRQPHRPQEREAWGAVCSPLLRIRHQSRRTMWKAQQRLRRCGVLAWVGELARGQKLGLRRSGLGPIQ